MNYFIEEKIVCRIMTYVNPESQFVIKQMSFSNKCLWTYFFKYVCNVNTVKFIHKIF